MDLLLSIKNLSVDFRGGGATVRAVEGASLTLNAGETVVLAGESGSGKTVTALSLCRLLPPNASIREGTIVFQGNDLLAMPIGDLAKIRGKQISYVFQEPSSYLNPVLTIGSQIAEVITLHQGKSRREAAEEAAGLLQQVKIRDPLRVLCAYPHQLSGGMNQRVFIAMALASRPALLVADEPTTSLDVTIEAEILALLMELKEKFSFSLLFITHNLSIAKKIADRVCVMYKGSVVEEGSRQAIFQAPTHTHTKELIAAYEEIGVVH